METKTIRVHPETLARLRRFGEQWGTPTMADTIDRLVEAERRRQILEQTNAAYAALRQDAAAWQAWQAETEELAGTLADGLSDEPIPQDRPQPASGAGDLG